MAKTKMTITVSTQGEIISKMRRPCGIDGTINGATKAEGNKGKRKAYNRRAFKDTRNWE